MNTTSARAFANRLSNPRLQPAALFRNASVAAFSQLINDSVFKRRIGYALRHSGHNVLRVRLSVDRADSPRVV